MAEAPEETAEEEAAVIPGMSRLVLTQTTAIYYFSHSGLGTAVRP